MKRKLRTIAGLMCAIFMFSCIPFFPGASASAAELTPVEQTQYGVVRVINIISETAYSISYATGTGFCVGNEGDAAQYFVTNNHCVEDNLNEVYVSITDWDGKIKAEVLYRDATNDLAIIKTSSVIADRHPVVLMSPSELNKSQDVWCIGFPGVIDDFSDKGESLSSTIDDITITKGTVSNPRYRTGGVSAILTDCIINHGNSGGPMVDEYGFVVGINTWGLSDGMNCAISIDYTMAALDMQGLPYMQGTAGGVIIKGAAPDETPVPEEEPEPTEEPADTEEDDENEDDEGISPITIVLLAAAAAVLAVIIILVVKLTKKKKPEPAPVQANSGSGSVVPKGSVSAAGETTYVSGQYNNQGNIYSQTQNYANTAFRPSVPKLTVMCSSGAIAGRSISSTSAVIIGRDPYQCSFTFPQETRGISKKHCQVRLMPTGLGIELTDLGSSYGTYLKDGTKLTPFSPVYLRNGDYFYLASKDTSITVQIDNCDDYLDRS